MTRISFMNELEALLADIPKEEKEEALQYYNDYFEDAGADHEEEILTELVSPQRVASIIKSDLGSNVEDKESREIIQKQAIRTQYFKKNGMKLK